MIAYLFYAAVVLVVVWWWKKPKEKSKDSFLIPDIPKGTVVLHQYGPAPYVPSISPFVMKLETFLRVAGIPYVNRYDRKPGPKGKIPWIQYNDDVIPDSQSVVEFLNKEFKVDLNKKLTNEQMAVGHVVRRMAEEWLYWVLVMFRVVFETNGTVYRQVGLPAVIIWYMRRAAKPRLLSQGIGRHSRQEVTAMMEDDLAAIDAILGQKNYLFGDSSDDVTEYDCALFGQLCQLTWQMPDCGVEELIQEKHPRLVSYCQRMKESFWPDWDDRLKTVQSKTNGTETATSPPSSPSLSSSSSSSLSPSPSSPSSASLSATLPPPPPSSSPSSTSLTSQLPFVSSSSVSSPPEQATPSSPPSSAPPSPPTTITSSHTNTAGLISHDTKKSNDENSMSTNITNNINCDSKIPTTTTTTNKNNSNSNISHCYGSEIHNNIIPYTDTNMKDSNNKCISSLMSTRKRLIADQGT